MKTFRLKGTALFEAEDIENALLKLAQHFFYLAKKDKPKYTKLMLPGTDLELIEISLEESATKCERNMME